MHLRWLVTYSAVFSVSLAVASVALGQGAPVVPQTCGVVAQARPSFFVVNTPKAITRQDASGNNRNLYYPRGTIVKVDPEDIGRMYYTETTLPKSFMPRVTVLSVPSENMSMDYGPRGAQSSTNDGGHGQRARAGMTGYINASDVMGLRNKTNVTEPTGMVFEVREDAYGYIVPELRNKPIRMSMENDRFLTKRCCPADMDPKTGLTDQPTGHPVELDRDSHCSYSPLFDILKPVDRGGANLSYVAEKSQVAIGDCDKFISSLSPVDPQNQRAAFMISDALRDADTGALGRLQTEFWRQANITRTRIKECGGATVSGNVYKCRCKEAVNDGLLKLGVIKTRIPGVGASEVVNYMPAMGFENILDRVKTPQEAPPGAVIVYKDTTGGYGHIEVKVDSNTFCSDFCKDAPISAYNRQRVPIAIYVKRR